MEQFLRTVAAAAAAALLLGACGRPSQADEERARQKAIAEAQERAHALKMKQLNGAELSSEEQAELKRSSEQAAEEENGGNTPEPPPQPQEEPGS